LPDHPQPDDATVVPAGQGQGASGHRLPVATRRPRVFRPRPWVTFTFAAVLGAVVVIIALVVWSLR
jgi:hypothetical protein